MPAEQPCSAMLREAGRYEAACAKALSTRVLCAAGVCRGLPPCRRSRLRRLYFEARHAGSSLTETEMGGITHPNQYFDLSMKFYADIHAAEQGAGEGKAIAGSQGATQEQDNAVSPAPMAVGDGSA